MSNKDIPTIEVDIDPVVQSVETFEKLGVSEASFNAFRQNVNTRVQANTDAIGVLDDRVDEAEAEIGARYTKDETDGLLAGKANKAQEAWITPTLLNGWTGTVRYRKDDFGVVSVEGTIAGGMTNPTANTSSAAFILTGDFAPASIRAFPTTHYHADTTALHDTASLRVLVTGYVLVYAPLTSNQRLYINFSFATI